MPICIDGKIIATRVIEQLKKKPTPQGFVAIFVRSSDMAADSFVKQKEKTAQRLGIEIRRYLISDHDTSDTLRRRVRVVARTKRCIGVVLQLPLPAACNPMYVANTIPVHKNIDSIGSKIASQDDQNGKNPIPPAVRVIEHILEEYHRDITSFSCVGVVGQGLLVGSPIAHYLQKNNIPTRLFDKGFDKKDLLSCDLIILGTGVVGLIRGIDIPSNTWVIDFGYGAHEGTLRGDFDTTRDAIDHIGLYTPTPGGTGPILVASLFENLYL